MTRWAAMSIRTMRTSLQEAGRRVRDLALPPICAGCNTDIEDSTGISLCQQCSDVFTTRSGPICSRCAAPAPQPSIRETGCLHCEQTSFRFHHIAALGVYEGKMQSLILRMKHLSGESLSLTVGKLLAQRIRELQWSSPPELITAAPMHWTRRLWRGVNAAALVAEGVAGALSLPLALDLLKNVRMVPRQSSLTAARRRHNMRNAFVASSAYNIKGAHVLIVDDVLTTGATANAAAQATRLAGASTISIGVIARGIGLA